MNERNDPLLFACGLAAFLFAVVLLLNMIEPSAIPVTREQFLNIKEAGLIESIIIHPEGVYWQLNRSIRIQGRNGEENAERIVNLKPDPSAISEWRNGGGEEREERGNARWVGLIFMALLIGVGLWHGWSQIQLDINGGGSPRRRLQDLDEMLKQGKITEEEFRDRSERIWPEL